MAKSIYSAVVASAFVSPDVGFEICLPTVAKVFENKFGQVVETSADLILSRFVWLRKRNEIYRFKRILGVRSLNVLAKSYLPCQCLYVKQKKKNLQSTKRPRYEFNPTVLC